MKLKLFNYLLSILMLFVAFAIGFGCSKQCPFKTMPAHCWTGKQLIVWNGMKIFMAFNPEENNWRRLSDNLNIEKQAYDPHLVFVDNEEILAAYWKTETHELLCLDYYSLSTDKWERFVTIESDKLKDPSIAEKDKIITFINGIIVMDKSPIVIIESRYGFSKVVCLKIDKKKNNISTLSMDNGPINTQFPAIYAFKDKLLYFGSQSQKNISWSLWDNKKQSWITSEPIDVIYGFGHTLADDSVYIYGGSIKYGTGETWNGGFEYSFLKNNIEKLPMDNTPKRRNCAICWTGKGILIWGGFDINEDKGFSLINDKIGLAYNPDGREWITIPDKNAPSPRFDPICYWTGKEMMIWSGYNSYENFDKKIVDFKGYAYDPEKRQWRQLSQLQLN